MIKNMLRKVAARLPADWQAALKRAHYRRQIRAGRFDLDGNEEAVLEALLRPGDWVLDIGANVGQYAVICSRIVGPAGRVIAVEPVPEAFALLASNCQALPVQNVTLLNLAASDRNGVRGMSIPIADSGLTNSTRAHFTGDEGHMDVQVLAATLDAMQWPHRIALVKIDTEGHELSVLRGITRLLSRDRPHVVVEASSEGLIAFLADFGYRLSPLTETPNYVLVHHQEDEVVTEQPVRQWAPTGAS